MLFPIEDLIKGRDVPLCIRENATIKEALALMIKNNYSQLPVVDTSQALLGMISEQSIVRMHFHLRDDEDKVSLMSLPVNHCRASAVTLSREKDIFEALNMLRGNTSAIVITENQKPIGILTDYDMTEFLRSLSEDAIRVRDVETKLRQYIEGVLSEAKAMDAALEAAFGSDRREPDRPARSYGELSFGQQVSLITTLKNWPRFESYFSPRPLFMSLMDQVRIIRNELFHFRDDPDSLDQNVLLTAINWLEGRPRLPVSTSNPSSKHLSSTMSVGRTGPIITSEGDERYGGKYKPLYDLLMSAPASVGETLELPFSTIEGLVGEPLSESAQEHESWWANDPVTNKHSLAWLRAGFKVSEVNRKGAIVTLLKSRDVLMQMQFADILDALKKTRPGITNAERTRPQSWFAFGAGRTGFMYSWSHARSELWVELYIDTGDRDRNKLLFESLYAQREAIEEEIGQPLTWQKLEHRKGCRIYAATKSTISDPPAELELANNWVVDMTLKFVDAFGAKIKQI